MSEAPIPAWKRAGLKRTAGAAKAAADSYDPLQEGLKRVHESGETKKPAKPPKRPKVAKSERPQPTFELDQLAYLRQYAEDRENWKFSKQKQNWILKHMFTDINDDKYDEPLRKYIEGLQGASRNWVCDDARKVVDEWNTFMLEEENHNKEEAEHGSEDGSEEGAKQETKDGTADKAKADDADKQTGTAENSEQEKASGAEKDGANKPKKAKKPKQPPQPQRKVPTEKMARRAQAMIKLIANEDVTLAFLDTDEAAQT